MIHQELILSLSRAFRNLILLCQCVFLLLIKTVQTTGATSTFFLLSRVLLLYYNFLLFCGRSSLIKSGTIHGCPRFLLPAPPYPAGLLSPAPQTLLNVLLSQRGGSGSCAQKSYSSPLPPTHTFLVLLP